MGAPRRGGALALLLVLLATATPGAQPDPDVEAAGQAALRQLEAFRQGDFDAAYAFASDAIRAEFDRPAFERMVRDGYPEIAEPASAVIDGSERGPRSTLYLFLRIRGANGRTVQAVYEMVRERSRWRINGVVTRPDPTPTV